MVLVAGGAAAAVLLLHPFGTSHPQPTASGRSGQHANRPLSVSATASSPAANLSPSAGSPASAEQQAAKNLAGLLGKSVADRSAVVQAYNNVGNCESLNHDVTTFQNAAGSRQTLLAELGELPGKAALPAGMLQSLTGAWQASDEADQAFATWAQDEMAKGCTPNDHADPGYLAANGPDKQATRDKLAFVRAWDPIANQYGLTAYRQGQL